MKAGWQATTLGKISQIKGGKRVPKGYTLSATPTEFPYIRVTDFNDYGTIDLNDLRYVDADVHSQIRNYIINSKDLYISIAGTIGKTGIIPDDLSGSNLTENACRLVFNSDINNRFIYYFTKTADFIEQAGVQTRTAAQPKLALSRLSNIQLAVPPLSEQHRIVTILDEAFEGIATATANAKKNLANARELFESYLQSIFTNKGDGWLESKLGDLCEELFAGGDVPKANSSKIKTELFNIPIFSNGEKNKGLYGFTNVIRVSKPSITVSARGTIGYSEIRNEPFYPAIRLIVVTPKVDVLNLFFLKYVIIGIDFTHSGSSIPQLTVPMIKEYPIQFPPLNIQQSIVSKLDDLFMETKKLEAIYQQKLTTLEELKKSILNQAFSGQLN